MQTSNIRNNWSNSLFFVAAASAACVGFSNIWLLPSLVLNNGGLVFIVLYIACLVIITLPILIAEIVIGYYSKANLDGGVRLLVTQSNSSSLWLIINYLGPITAILLFINLSLIGSWPLYYLFQIFESNIQDLNVARSQVIFTTLIDSNNNSTLAYTILLSIVGILLFNRVKVGIGYFSIVALLLLLICLIVISVNVFTADANSTNNLLSVLTFNLNDLTIKNFIVALNHSLFTLLIGVGAMIAYGSYLAHNRNIIRNCCYIISIDVAIAILSVIAIVPLAITASSDSTSLSVASTVASTVLLARL